MILVTGATGFLGSELVRQLVGNGLQVRALKRKSSVIPPILETLPGIGWIDGDILDYFSLEKAFEGVSHVYHCAALISFQPSDRKELLNLNSQGTGHIVNLCLEYKVEKLVHVSSVAALGEPKTGGIVSEENYWEFNGKQHGYSISKYESEMEVWRGIAEGLNAVIVNPSLIIGPAAGVQGSGQLFETLRNGLKFYTEGSCGLVDVEDVAKAMILLMGSEISGERFLISAENWKFKDLFDKASDCFNVAKPARKARPWMMELAWRGAGAASIFTGKKYGITKETAQSAFKQNNFSSEKFATFFPEFRFKPIAQTIEEICKALKTLNS